MDYTTLDFKKLINLHSKYATWTTWNGVNYSVEEYEKEWDKYEALDEELNRRIERLKYLENIQTRLLESMVNYSESQEFIDAFHYILEGNK